MNAAEPAVAGALAGPAQAPDRPGNGRLAIVAWPLRVILTVVATGSLLVELAVVLANLVARELFGTSLSWTIAVSDIALVLLGFIGGALAYERGRDIRVDALVLRLPPRAREGFEAATDWVSGGVAAVICYWAAATYQEADAATIPGLPIRAGLVDEIIGGGMACVVIVSAVRLCRRPRRAVAAGVLPALVVAGAIAAVQYYIEAGVLLPSVSLILGAVVAVVMLLSGTPIGFSLLLLPVIDMAGNGEPISYVPSQLEAGLGNYILLAIPFFVFSGHLLTEGGLGKAIIDMLAPLLRRAPGGLLQLVIGTTFVFSGMSGAKIADVAAVGSALRNPLEEEGYDRSEAAAVLSACAAAGETVPPSIAMLILGSITSLSIGTLFVAGIVPALLLSLAIAALVAIRSRRGLTRTGTAGDAGTAWSPSLILRGLPALGLPVVLVGGTESGIVTATEAGALAVIYAIVVGALTRPRLTVRGIARIAEQSAAMSGMLLLLISVASALASSFALAQIPQDIGAWLADMGRSPVPLLLLTILLVPIAGAVLEGIPAILVFGPLLIPAATELGINGVQYGIVFILAMGMGAFSPLLGIGFFTSCRILDADIGRSARRYAGYFVAMMAATCVVAFVPQVALFLPRLFGLTGA